MTLPASGPLSLSNIQTEFGGTNPISLNEYYAGGGLVPAGTTGTYGAVPSSGTISVQNFYGTTAYTPIYVEEVYSTFLYRGTGALLPIVNGINLSSNGGLVWIKSRNVAFSSGLVDTARGVNYVLQSDASTMSTLRSGSVFQSFNSNGFTIQPPTGYGDINDTTPYNYVAWTFRKQPKFFDIVTYTGTGVARTIAHNLGSVPGCIIIKRTSDNGTGWWVYHRGNTASGAAQGQDLRLNQSNATNSNADVWNNTAPTSSVFSIGAGASPYDWNGSGGTFIAYLFAHNAAGFGPTGTDNVISCGSYTGNGSTSGPTVTLGYEPQWLMIKAAGTTGSWQMIDNMRGMANAFDDKRLLANIATSEFTNDYVSPTATGFNLVSDSSEVNGSGANYVYIAIRRGPMKVPTAGTSVFTPVVWTGTGSGARVITGASNPPDMLFLNTRNTGNNYWNWFDRLRGFTSTIYPYASSAENATAGQQYGCQSINMNGHTLGDLDGGAYNASGVLSFVCYFSRAPGFFDVVCYTGTGSAQNVTHNLTVAPELVIIKSRSNGGSGYGWVVGSSALPSWGRYLQLNTADQVNPSNNAGPFNNTAPTSSVLTVNTWTETNGSGSRYIAHLFATIANVSKVGSYTGNSGTQTIACGFSGSARFVLIKRTDSTGDWLVWDSARGMVSGTDPRMSINTTSPEANANWVLATTGGFQLVTSDFGVNSSGGTYIFLAIA